MCMLELTVILVKITFWSFNKFRCHGSFVRFTSFQSYTKIYCCCSNQSRQCRIVYLIIKKVVLFSLFDGGFWV